MVLFGLKPKSTRLMWIQFQSKKMCVTFTYMLLLNRFARLANLPKDVNFDKLRHPHGATEFILEIPY